MSRPQAATAPGDGRWRLLAAVAILVVTAFAVVLTRGTSSAQTPADPSALGETDAAFLQLMIAMNDSALGLFVLVPGDSPALAEMAGQLAESHRAELREFRVALTDGGGTEDSSLTRDNDQPGMITGDDLVEVHQAPAASRDVLVIELIYRHLTQGAQAARVQERSGGNAAVKALAVKIQSTRTTQLIQMTRLPTS